METNQVSEHLQVIRTLMERSALYRRELAPVMLSTGTIGVAAAAIGLELHLESMGAFAGLWLCTAAVAVAGAFLIARRQAFKDHESFWSPPTRRVAHALLPPFYGCALHAAGFFIPRGMKLFGWVFVGLACISLMFLAIVPLKVVVSAHWLMGFFFGVLHLACGAYLRLTARRNSAA
jgi:hypothetical protein